jgi:hypothetical protein
VRLALQVPAGGGGGGGGDTSGAHTGTGETPPPAGLSLTCDLVANLMELSAGMMATQEEVRHLGQHPLIPGLDDDHHPSKWTSQFVAHGMGDDDDAARSPGETTTRVPHGPRQMGTSVPCILYQVAGVVGGCCSQSEANLGGKCHLPGPADCCLHLLPKGRVPDTASGIHLMMVLRWCLDDLLPALHA